MSWYLCRIHGKNFPGEILGERKPVGFHTTRFVQANTAGEAETHAIQQIENDPALKLPTGVVPLEITKVYSEGTHLVEEAYVPKGWVKGFLWYIEESA